MDDCPKYRMVGSIGYCDGKGGSKTNAVFCALDADPVVTISVHFVTSVSLIVAGMPTDQHQNLDGTILRWLTVIVVSSLSTASTVS
jgi:hypothetical protein